MDVSINVGNGKCNLCGAGSSVAGASPDLITVSVHKTTLCERCIHRIDDLVRATVVNIITNPRALLQQGAPQPSPFLHK